MKRLIGFILCISSVAQADRIYKYVGNSDSTEFRAQSQALSQIGVQIIDEIPQLKVVVTKDLLPANSTWLDLGEPQTLQLIDPKPSDSSTPGEDLWGLRAIHAQDAWPFSQGEGVVVAVSDTGIDSDHPDLAQNMWKNSAEAQGQPGVDDDNNGYVDDVYGWDFVKSRPSGVDHHYHGTHVAGTIAALPSKQIAGVAPKAKLMDVSFLNAGGSGSELNAAKSIVYASDNGAKIINCSWGAPGYNNLVDEAIAYAQTKGVLIVAAAGNAKLNTDRDPYTPATIPQGNIISVAATASKRGDRASFSNFGKRTIDVAAPGKRIRSTTPSKGDKARYRSLDGTSMASPHTAGVVALIWSQHPEWNWQQVKEHLHNRVIKTNYWQKKNISGGMIDAFRAVSP